MIRDHGVRTFIAILVSTIWGLSAIAAVITEDYTGLGIITPVMMLVGAFIFGFRENQQISNGVNKNTSKKEDSG